MAAALGEIVSYLQEELQVREIPDYPGAHNGLQVANGGEVKYVGAAVDASGPVIREAVEAGVDLLLVHHGLFWAGVQPLVGATYEKFKLALDHDLAIYSAHIPLDVHERWGNNVGLAAALGWEETEPFFPWKGILLGRRVTLEVPESRAQLLERLAMELGGRVHCAPGGPETVERVGIITGGAGSEVAAMASEGVDTFITGEGPHHTYALAEELRINLIYAGHYATETFGVRALAEHLGARFGLKHTFLDHPSGL